MFLQEQLIPSLAIQFRDARSVDEVECEYKKNGQKIDSFANGCKALRDIIIQDYFFEFPCTRWNSFHSF